MIGRVFQGRYQIVQSLGAGVFGQTYIAIDVEQPQNPKCVIKQLKANGNQPSYLETLRLRFLTETETLKHLGHHDQIPQLLTCFEENERFYLVQEYVEGHALAAELPLNRRWGYIWGETEVVQFLRDVLGILHFVHSHGVIHCDIKPENLIRRISDGKIVLIDFGSIQPAHFSVDGTLPIYSIPATSLGYIPAEQFISQPKPNSDLYALAAIAIQALTGLAPLQLPVDSNTNEIIWRQADTPVSDYLAAVLSKMIRYNYKERYDSALEVLRVLEQMPLSEHQSQSDSLPYTILESSESDLSSSPTLAASSKSPPLLTGMKLGLAANSIVIGFGVYSLTSNSSPYSETNALYQATEEYQSGNIDKAIALAKSIQSNSNVYPEAQATIEEWRQQWKIAAEKHELVKQAHKQGKWSNVLQAAAQVPDILYWQNKTTPLVNDAKTAIEKQSKELLALAYERAAVQDFSAALEYLRQIPKETSAGALVQQKLAEYTEKKQAKSAYLLQRAINRAALQDYNQAIKILQQVPKDSSFYATAQAKLVEYEGKRKTYQEIQKAALSANNASVALWPFFKHSTSTGTEGFQPGSNLQEVNIQQF